MSTTPTVSSTMRAARMYGYNQPLVLEEVPTPDIGPDEVLIKVGAAGMCRTDVQLVDGYFDKYAPSQFPVIPGHEIAGEIVRVGSAAEAGGHREGDQVVVVGGMGDGTCRHCHRGDTQICSHGAWPGFGPYGGYAEYVPVPAAYVIKVDRQYGLNAEQLAPLTDAGLTPYRGLKKLRDAGALAAGRVVGVMGVGALGTYAVQYAKLLGAGATVVAFARNQDKLDLAKKLGADHAINIGGRSLDEVRAELNAATGQSEIDAGIDCAGAEEMIRLGFGLLATAGHYSSVGLVGDRIDIPLFPLVAREYTYHGSFWGNYNDLSEVVALAQQGKVQHTIHEIAFDDVNDAIDRIRTGEIVGRAVIKY
ncbi:NAD(P)-dependent alcohol dehydrogenase [Streptomyces yaanensis]|uniref:alcohol dehydrogenase n=1 Tax=Streptomyces yaanensis TaxID=1142239 RepID=A0ABV7S4S0_9ACTN|nr:NAD(P)-dependent alcohol dehydrogenase [Streptomyces sp. CGMCC 4.7035]WNB99674.1 NAD(P)-dependent alcohol dehydrogenase [Streptomyces sp. CGMCC 4.7035]